MLTKKDILDANDLKLITESVPEWGGDVCIRGLNAGERDHFEASIGSDVNLDNVRARLVVLCICDEKGKRIFNNQDADNLGKKSAVVVDRLFDIARKLSGMSDDDIKEMEKN